MDEQIFKWSRDVVDGIRTSILERMDNETVRDKDYKTMAQMAGNLMEEISGEAQKGGEMNHFYNLLAELQTEFIPNAGEKPSKERIRELADAMDKSLDEIEKVQYIANALQLDAQSIIPLMEQLRQKQEEVRQSLQKALDLDIKLYGEASEVTKQSLEAFHYDISDDKQVITVAEVKSKETIQQNIQESKANIKEVEKEAVPSNEESHKENLEALYLPPQGKEQFQKTIAFLKEKGAQYNSDKKTWYMVEGSIPWKELEAHHIEPAIDKREYLQLPPQGRSQFAETVAFLKENGARFDAGRKEWYIFPGANAEKVKAYLNKKDSVLGKLNRNKTGIEKQGTQIKENSMER